MSASLHRLKRSYSTAAILLLNTVVFVLVLNVLLYGAFYVRDTFGGKAPSRKTSSDPERASDDGELFNADGSPARSKPRSWDQLDWFDYSAYGGISQEYASRLLDDFYQLGRLGFAHQPWVQFSEPEFDGQLLHVDRDARGFPIRRTLNPESGQGPVMHVFVLGGSTTLGYHVSDEHTYPTYLSAILNAKAKGKRVEVTNYGHSYFNPSQEAFLLADLLKSGHRPSLVIFMDGVNPPTVTDATWLTNRAAAAFRNVQFPPSYTDRLEGVPFVRLANSFRRRVNGDASHPGPDRGALTVEHVRTAINSFRQSRDIAAAIASLYGVPTMFFLQPNALYNYDLRLYRRTVTEDFLQYRRFMTPVYEELTADPGYIDLSGLFERWGHRKAIVDDVHYNPAFNEFLAQEVAGHIDLDSLKPGSIDVEAATGRPRDAE